MSYIESLVAVWTQEHNRLALIQFIGIILSPVVFIIFISLLIAAIVKSREGKS